MQNFDKLGFNLTPEPTYMKQECGLKKHRYMVQSTLFSINMKTNIGKVFFKLLRKHFPKTHKFYKIFNKNTKFNLVIAACVTWQV